ncbi:MAG: serine/threonine protein kinase [Gammaproteobacteria bacterium]|nr:serine/threonine protein kinase [Gammaproteobacteria bacterium]
MPETRINLPPGTTIDCYSIIRLIGTGGFSLIYLAEDQKTQEHVLIKEYLPKRLATRGQNLQVEIIGDKAREPFNQGKRLFYKEAIALSTLRHPNIVNIRTFFLCYGTAYMVMDYEQGKNLGNYIKRHKGKLSARFLMAVFPPVLDALRLIHSQGQLHLDIKPGNMHLRPGGNPLLLDFGAIHQFATSRRSRFSQVVTPGFSPIEQYYPSGYVGPWSDVYAIGSTMRACIEGGPPPSAVERHAKDTMQPAAKRFKRRYPKGLLEVIDWAMEVDPLLRPQNAGSMLQALTGEVGDDEDNTRTSKPK